MLFSSSARIEKRKDAELIAIPFWDASKKPKLAASVGALEPLFVSALQCKDFFGKEGEILLLYGNKQTEKRILLLGLGREESVSVDGLRRAYASLVKECQRKGLTRINVVMPNIVELRKITLEECLRGVAEGILLMNYKFESLITVKEETVLLESVQLIGILPKDLEIVARAVTICEGVHLARDLINGNADIITPAYLADSAEKTAQKFPKVKATIFDKRRIEKEKMGLLLAVARGASVNPYFIILEYKGLPSSKEHTVLVGKGITFDTGGLNLKPTGSMETMRDDMAGAAAVLSTVAVAATLDLKINVTAVVATCENAIDGASYKPGDVYKSYAGTTVEIANTDAEGRLTLADALAYSVKNLKPTRIIDLATLTGAIVVSLGDGMSGLFCNDDSLASDLLQASETSGELLWRMPLYVPYKEDLKSDIADLRNAGSRSGSAIKAALFLQEFVGKTPWAHIDIAGVAFGTKERGYTPKNGVGFGVRLLIDMLQKNYDRK